MLIGFGGTRRSCGFVVAVLAAPLAWAGSPTVSSTFDTDLEGWTPVGLDIGFTVIPPSFSISPVANTPDMVFDAGGGAFDGNPGGFARFTDVIEEPSSFASAPAEYLGDLSGYIGGTFSFDHRLFDEGSDAESVAPYAIVFISGDPNDLNAYGAIMSGPMLGDADTGWVTVSADINETDFVAVSTLDLGLFDPSLDGITSGTFGFNTSMSFNDVMSNVTMVLLSFELVDNNSAQVSEAGGIDNVTLAAVPEPTSIVLLGLAGVLLVRRRRD